MNVVFESLIRDGYVVIKNAINLDDSCEMQFDEVTERLSGQVVKNFNATDIPYGVISPLERSYEMTENIMKCGGVRNIIERVFDNQVLFFGSDFGIFNRSSVFHRDVGFQSPLYKMKIYLDGSYGNDQQMKFITGTHHVADTYARMVGKACRWPQGGGININSFTSFFNLTENKGFPKINVMRIEIERGDIVIFDQRILHAVESNQLRRLISLTMMPSFQLFKDVWCEPRSLPSNESEFTNWFFLIKCAFRSIERKRFKNHISSHKNLPFLSTALGEFRFFDKWEEEDFEKATRTLFPDAEKEGNSEILRILDPYGYGNKSL